MFRQNEDPQASRRADRLVESCSILSDWPADIRGSWETGSVNGDNQPKLPSNIASVNNGILTKYLPVGQWLLAGEWWWWTHAGEVGRKSGPSRAIVLFQVGAHVVISRLVTDVSAHTRPGCCFCLHSLKYVSFSPPSAPIGTFTCIKGLPAFTTWKHTPSNYLLIGRYLKLYFDHLYTLTT